MTTIRGRSTTYDPASVRTVIGGVSIPDDDVTRDRSAVHCHAGLHSLRVKRGGGDGERETGEQRPSGSAGAHKALELGTGELRPPKMRGPCQPLTSCAASLARSAGGGRRPLGRTRERRSGDGADQLCSILRIHPVADHAKGGVAIEIEAPHEIGNRAVHVAAAAGPEAAEEAVKPLHAVARALSSLA